METHTPPSIGVARHNGVAAVDIMFITSQAVVVASALGSWH
jgi:hypothetical protein